MPGDREVQPDLASARQAHRRQPGRDAARSTRSCAHRTRRPPRRRSRRPSPVSPPRGPRSRERSRLSTTRSGPSARRRGHGARASSRLASSATPADITPPRRPPTLVAIASERSVRLSWTPSPDPDVVALRRLSRQRPAGLRARGLRAGPGDDLHRSRRRPRRSTATPSPPRTPASAPTRASAATRRPSRCPDWALRALTSHGKHATITAT